MSGRERLIVFTRYPEPGTTKTRLIPALGPEGAADLQRRMTRHALSCASRCDGVPVEVRYAGGDEPLMRQAFGSAFGYVPQGDGDLGARMDRGFRSAFDHGAGRVVVIGSDCPGITPELLRDAFAALERNDLVLGPAADGGYYLIGLRRPTPELFSGTLPWGMETVRAQTLAIAEGLGLSTALLPELDDVDRPEDLHLVEHLGRTATPAASISVIIPALNEADRISEIVEHVRQQAEAEIIVVDGGSSDDTVPLAEAAGATVLRSPKGRAIQMNAGARAASGNILLFLHADTLLPERFADHVTEALSRPGVVAGAFEFRVDRPTLGLRFIQKTSNFRSRHMAMPYGDQGIFLTAETFHEIGGFPEQPIMEDFELVRRLRRRGEVVTVPVPAITSARRWREHGFLRTTIMNQVVIIAYLLGVSPERLAKWYGR